MFHPDQIEDLFIYTYPCTRPQHGRMVLFHGISSSKGRPAYVAQIRLRICNDLVDTGQHNNIKKACEALRKHCGSSNTAAQWHSS